jgi:hypothetical protein
MAPNLSAGPDGVVLTWLEPEDPETHEVFSLRMARLDSETWGEPREISKGDTFFANWVDLPAVAAGGDGTWVTHWLEMLGDATYAYGVQMATSTDGQNWTRGGLLHSDTSPTEHGFVSYVPTTEGTQAFWLDGRAMTGQPPGPMQLRTALLRDGAPEGSTVLDEKVCECCSTDAALTAQGPVVVYRDRSDEEIRNIGVVRATTEGWSEPTLLHDDGWRIQGCPVNGPAISAAGNEVAVSWFTIAENKPQVRLAFSNDAGATFSEPVIIDDEEPVGRVDVELDDEGHAWVVWLGRHGEEGEIRLLRVSPSGELGKTQVLAKTSASRSAGVPRMLRDGERLVFAWVEVAEPSRVQVGVLPLG